MEKAGMDQTTPEQQQSSVSGNLRAEPPADPARVLRLMLRPHLKRSPNRTVKFEAYLDHQLVCTSHQPLLDGARTLLARGYPAETLLTTRCEGNGYDNVIPVPIGRLAKLTTEESSKVSAKFVAYQESPWKASPLVEGSRRMRNSAAEVAGQPPDHNASVQAVAVPLAAE